MHLHTCDILWSTVVIILSDVHIVHLWLVGTSSSLFQSIGWIKTSYHNIIFWGSVQFSRSVVSDSLRPHELQPGLSVHHQLPEFTQTHTHRVSDAIQPSHPLSSPSPPAPNPSQHQGLFQWVNSSHEVAKVLEFQLQHQSFKDWSSLGWTGWISLQSKGLSRVFSNTTVQKHQFFGTQLSSQSNSHIHTWPLEKP